MRVAFPVLAIGSLFAPPAVGLHAHLSNTYELPLVGFGIGNLQHDRIHLAVEEAVKQGVQLIDTAAASKNEHLLAKALGGVSGGGDVQVLTKVWYTHLGYERTLLSVKESAEKLGKTPEIVILHWPRCNDNIGNGGNVLYECD